MLFNLYQISSEDTATILEIKADMASLLFNFDQGCVIGRYVEGSNLIKSCFVLVSSVSASALASISESSGKKCFNLLTIVF
jgi:hypothetical protein